MVRVIALMLVLQVTVAANACRCQNPPVRAQGKQAQGKGEKKKGEKAAEGKGGGKKKTGDPVDKPLDEAKAAAEALEKLFGGKAKPVTERPEPPQKPAKADPQGAEKPKPQDPKPDEKVDEAKAGAEAVKKLLPGARNVEQRPDQRDPEDPRPGTESEWSGPGPESTGPSLAQSLPVHGNLSVRYRGRWNHDDSDQDMWGLLALDVGDPDLHPVSVHFLGRANLDLDGGERRNAFNGIDETYSKDLTARLYEAYADVHAIDHLRMVRIGRQNIYDTPELAYFDGIRVETEEFTPLDLWAGAYTGIPTYLYESSWQDDFIAGASVGVSPWSGARARFDWMHVEDDTDYGSHDNDLLGIAAWQTIGQGTQLHGRYTWLKSKGRDFLVRVHSNWAEPDLQVQASYYELMSTQRSLAIEFDPFFQSAFEYVPYRQLNAYVGKGVGDHLMLTGGIDIRRLRDRGDERQYNREFQRYYLTSSFLGLARDRISIDFTGEWWDTRQGEDIVSVDAEIRMEISPELAAKAGSGYWLYKFDLLSNRERERVQAYYAGFDYLLAKGVRVDFEYAFEDDDVGDYHVLQVVTSWSF